MPRFITVIFSLLLATNLHAQYKIGGTVNDTEKEPLSFASVVLLKQSDSTMVTYGLTNGKGVFELNVKKKGEYFIQYTFLGYKSIFKIIETDWSEKNILLPAVYMELSDIKLQEVSIEAERTPMIMRGDTLQYDARAFKTKAGDDVEALIKKLPGIEVDQNGKITAQGKEVKKVLVNGKEFFSNDPKIATKGLDAEAIDKVEVLDKKSKEAEFTGIDDGEEEKAINLILKEEYNKGSFGQAYLAAGSEETYKGKLNYNRFSDKTQSSIIANGNNLNEQEFSFSEYRDLNPSGGGLNMGFLNGIGGNEGINNGLAAGANINHEFSKKLEINANYFLITNKNELEKEISSTNFTTAENFQKEQVIRKKDEQLTHSISTKVEWKPDSMTQLNFDGNFYLADQDFLNQSTTIFSSDSSLKNTTNNNLNTNIDKWSTYLDLGYKRKFNKKGRNIVANYNYYYGLDHKENDLKNVIQSIPLDQFQNFKETFNRHRSHVSYTEPIGKDWYITGRYAVKAEENHPNRQFFNRTNGGSSLDTNLSGKFNREVLENKGSLTLKRSTKKTTLGVGGTISSVDLIANEIKRNFQYFTPNLWMRVKLKGSQNIRISYSTGINLPSLRELISISDNVNPNQKYVGNPDLKPEYRHRFFGNYFLFDPVKSTSYYLYLNYTKTLNKVVNQTVVQPDFTTEISPVNTNLSDAYTLYASLSQPIKRINLKYNFGLSGSYSKFKTFLNESATLSANQSYAVNGELGRDKAEKWDINIGGSVSFNYQTYEIKPDFNQKFNNYSWYANGELSITKTLLFSVKYTVSRYSAVAFAEAQTLHFVNASLRKSFQDDKWAISVIANDILDENRGIARRGDVNSIIEENYNSRAQYFMLSVSRKFGKRKSSN